jgi:acyl-CoA synthetase (AMP-forming)/AMP-acid ligase II
MSALPENLVDALEATAARYGNDRGIRFYANPETSEFIGYADIARNAKSIAANLTAKGHGLGETVLIALSPGLGWTEAAYGVMYGGLAFVPAPISGYGTPANVAEKAAGIGRSAEASFLLTDRPALEKLGGAVPGFEDATLFVEDLLADGDPDAWTAPALEPGSLAYLLFTSGSTGDPKGVIGAHGVLAAGVYANTDFYADTDGDSVFVGWAPLHHIGGLAMNILVPATLGVDSIITPTEQFQRRPVFWLQLMSRHKGTVSSAGNFAFALCTRFATDEHVAELDLSSVRVLMCGSEPILPQTMEAFIERFAPAGLDRNAIAPTMGSTDGGLISAKLWGDELVIGRFDATQLESGRLVRAQGEGTVEWVSCGRSTNDTVLRIVDPETLEVLPEGRVGEIWTSGPTVSPGYFHLPEATAETFGLSLPGEDRSFMRTGDLAAILDGQVYVTGRLKEMIIVRGRNLYPQDLEAAARTASPAVGIGAAFELTGAASVAGLVIEIDDDELSASGDTLDEVVRKVKDVVMSRFSLPSLAVATLPLNLLPRTPSGKVRRGPTRLAMQAGELPTTSAVGFAPSTHS